MRHVSSMQALVWSCVIAAWRQGAELTGLQEHVKVAFEIIVMLDSDEKVSMSCGLNVTNM